MIADFSPLDLEDIAAVTSGRKHKNPEPPEPTIEKRVLGLVGRYGFGVEARAYLVSIAWQQEQAGEPRDVIEKYLVLACERANSSGNPTAALKRLDGSVVDYLRSPVELRRAVEFLYNLHRSVKRPVKPVARPRPTGSIDAEIERFALWANPEESNGYDKPDGIEAEPRYKADPDESGEQEVEDLAAKILEESAA